MKGVGSAPRFSQRRAIASRLETSSSTAAGWSGTAEELSQSDMEEDVLPSASGIRPGGIRQDSLTAELIGDAKTLGRAKTGDAFTPVRVLALAHRAPVPGHELPNPAGDHKTILVREADLSTCGHHPGLRGPR